VRDVRDLHARTLAEFGERVHRVGDDAWDDDTACTEWTVRDLVNHLVSEQRWAVSLLGGATLAEVGDRFDGDLLGDDPVGAWDTASREARQAAAAVDLDRVVHLSYGAVPASSYLFEMAADALVHAWDLARGIGADERLDPELVAVVYDAMAPRAGELAASGLFAPPVPVADDADTQTRLLALTGRHG
jgi:uncharacterized protein (TIGR03086 family)